MKQGCTTQEQHTVQITILCGPQTSDHRNAFLHLMAAYKYFSCPREEQWHIVGAALWLHPCSLYKGRMGVT